MAALIEHQTGTSAEIVEGSRGEFSVWVGDTRVAQKTRDEGFPDDRAIVTAVRDALAAAALAKD